MSREIENTKMAELEELERQALIDQENDQRDLFAAEALQGMLASTANPHAPYDPSRIGPSDIKRLTDKAYEYGQAMLESRKKYIVSGD
jgi:hypothetical protein